MRDLVKLPCQGHSWARLPRKSLLRNASEAIAQNELVKPRTLGQLAQRDAAVMGFVPELLLSCV